MNGKGDKDRVANLTRYEKKYTKIFGDWMENRTPVPNSKKKKKVEKSKK